MSDQETFELTVLCCGTRLDDAGKTAWTKYEVLSDGPYQGQTLHFKKSRDAGWVGMTYTAQFYTGDKPGHISGMRGGFSATTAPEGCAPTEERLAADRLDHEMAEGIQAMAAQAKKFDIEEICPGFDRLKAAYWRTNGKGRAVLEARILAELRKG